jgi:peptide/nickel transport system permease protein
VAASVRSNAHVWRRFARHRLALVGAVLLVTLASAAALAPWLAPYRFEEIDLENLFGAMSRRHPMGTDEVGHDVLTRIMHAGRISLTVGIAASLNAVALGTALGLAAGYYGRLLDRVVMRITDGFLAIPAIAAMFVFANVIGPGIRGIIIVLVALGWMGTARLARAEALRLRDQDFVEAARALGASDRRILLRHLLPNALAPIIVSVTLNVGVAILAESTISYFGLGIQPPVPSWGNMLRNSQEYLWTAPWLAFWPGLFIFVTVLSCNFIGDGLRDALDPRLGRHGAGPGRDGGAPT